MIVGRLDICSWLNASCGIIHSMTHCNKIAHGEHDKKPPLTCTRYCAWTQAVAEFRVVKRTQLE